MSRSAEAQKLSLGIPGALAQGERASPAYSSGAFRRINHRVRQRMYVEHGYAKRYGVDDGELAELVGGIWTRE